MDNITDLTEVVKRLEGRIFPTNQPCKHCKNQQHKIAEGKGPHAAQYRCGACGSFISWISKSSLINLSREA